MRSVVPGFSWVIVRQGRDGDLGVDLIVRPACSVDAAGIGRAAISALRTSNKRNHSGAAIARVEQGFSPAAVSDHLKSRLVFVDLDHGSVVGTASLDCRVVRAVFVDPRYQGRSIGRAPMAEVERAASERGITAPAVPSSVTAKPFFCEARVRSGTGQLSRTGTDHRPWSVRSSGPQIIIKGRRLSAPPRSRAET